MGHALAYVIVHCEETALGSESPLNRRSQTPDIAEKSACQIIGKIEQCRVMFFGNQKSVAGEKGAVVEKGETDFIFKNNPRLDGF